MAASLTKVFKAINDFSDNMEKTTINNLKEHLVSKLTDEYDSEFVEAVSNMIDDYVTNMPKTPAINAKEPKKEKKTRAPTAYNLFLKAKMAEIKEAGTELKGKELMQAAIVEWNKQKALNPPEDKKAGPSRRNILAAIASESEPEPEQDTEADAEKLPEPSKGKGKGKGKK